MGQGLLVKNSFKQIGENCGSPPSEAVGMVSKGIGQNRSFIYHGSFSVLCLTTFGNQVGGGIKPLIIIKVKSE